MMKNSAINMVVMHINVPYRNIVTREHLVRVLTTGTLSSLPDGDPAKSILHWLFLETEPYLIVMSVHEAGSNPRTANMLYEELVRDGQHRVHDWEESVQYMI